MKHSLDNPDVEQALVQNIGVDKDDVAKFEQFINGWMYKLDTREFLDKVKRKFSLPIAISDLHRILKFLSVEYDAFQ